jgi:hypothetical protein
MISKKQKITKGTLAFCSLGTLGLITEDKPKNIIYPDGNKAKAYIGIHLTDKMSKIGSPWSSRKPKVVAHIKDFEYMIEEKQNGK